MIKPEIVNTLDSIHELTLLMYLEQIEEWNHTKDNRELLSTYLGIAGITLKVSLKRLIDKGYIIKPSKAKYKINKDIIL